MTTALLRLTTAAVMLFGLGLSTVAAQPATFSPVPPPVPDDLRVPEGHTLFLATRATGTQNYICLTVAKRSVGWRFIGPQATLFVDVDGAPLQITTHFLSANPSEGMLARPTWQHSADTSRVWARVRKSSTDPDYVALGAIPWLLLEVAGTAAGPTGGDFLVPTTFIQRLNTSGGVAPAAGCSNDDDIGKVVLVPYTTDYFFFRASGG